MFLHDYRSGAMALNGFNRFKMINYGYDLVSGKVNYVGYQPGKLDELHHRYGYDAENRLLEVFTTHRKPFVGDRNVEEKEAAYHYYHHGPLARTELGTNKAPGSNHRSIDNDQLNNVMSDINNFLKGKDAVKIAKERTQPTYNPADSNSPNVFAPGDTKGGTKGTVNPKSTRDDNNKSKSSKTDKKPGG